MVLKPIQPFFTHSLSVQGIKKVAKAVGYSGNWLNLQRSVTSDNEAQKKWKENTAR